MDVSRSNLGCSNAIAVKRRRLPRRRIAQSVIDLLSQRRVRGPAGSNKKGFSRIRVLDVGCGGGALLDYLRQRLGAEVIGIDRKPPDRPKVPIVAADAVTERLPEADVAVCCLTAHHLTPEQNIQLIRNVSRSCPRFILHDLIRHRLPFVLFTLFLCPLIGREAAVDGRQSIRRAFTPEEFQDLVRTALAGTQGTFTTDVSPFRSRQIVDIRF